MPGPAPPSSLHLSDQQYRVAQRRAIIANLGVVAFAVVTGGQLSSDVLQLYANQVLGLPPSQIGLALGLLVLALPAQVLGVGLADRFGRKRLLTAGYAITIVIISGFFILPWVFSQNRGWGYLTFVAILLSSEVVFLGSWGVTWWPWMREITRPADRAGFFARMRFLVNAFAALVLFVFGLVVGRRMSVPQYDVLLIIIIGWLLVAIWQIRSLPSTEPDPGATRSDRPDTVPQRRSSPVVARWKAVFRNAWFVRLLAVRVGMEAVTVPGYVLYARNVLTLSNRTIAFQLSGRTLVGISALLVWGRLTNRHGYRRVLRATAGGLAIVALLWFLVPPKSDGGFTAVAISSGILALTAMLNSGFLLAHLTAIHGIVTDSTASVGLPAYAMMEAAIGYGSIFVAGLVLTATTATNGFGWAFIHVDWFKLFVSVGVAAGVITALLLRHLPGPTEAPIQAPIRRAVTPAST